VGLLVPREGCPYVGQASQVHPGVSGALTGSDLVEPAIAAEQLFHATGLTTLLGPTIHQLADRQPTTLAVMHGASFSGDGAAQLRALVDGYAAMAAR
jgi:hypothetical protein